jgi:hypothetical protein
MQSKLMKSLGAAAILLFAAAGTQAAFAAAPTDACSLLTPAQVSAVLGMAVGPGASLTPKVCRWGGREKAAIVTLQDPRAFVYAKMPAGNGIVKTPAGGIGDDAVYGTSPGAATVLTVKKGEAVFVVHVTGFSEDEIKAKEKSLALDVIARL